MGVYGYNKDFGLIPEIIGRLPVLTYMNPLDKDSVSFYFKKASKNAFKVRDPLLISRVYAFKGLLEKPVLIFLISPMVERATTENIH